MGSRLTTVCSGPPFSPPLMPGFRYILSDSRSTYLIGSVVGSRNLAEMIVSGALPRFHAWHSPLLWRPGAQLARPADPMLDSAVLDFCCS